MPELPEVETVRLSILPVLQGRVIGQASILTPEVWLSRDLPAAGWLIDTIDRRGKYLLFRLSRPAGVPRHALLIVHLRMTGQLLLQTSDLPAVKHDHVRLRLDPAGLNGERSQLPIWLVFHDTRRFGRMWLLPEGDPLLPAGLARLGPEPLDPAFSAEVLAAQLAHRKRISLKAALLDQTVVAGLGNIYTDEVLFASGLNPAQSAGSLDEAAIAGLARAIAAVLHRAITCQGTTLRDYVNGWNQKGTFQDCLMVYGRAGQPCRRCGSPISHTRLAGRGTCWCPVCQPEIGVAGKAGVTLV